MKTIFKRLFVGHLLASFAVLIMMSAIFVVAIETSISHWNRDEAQDMVKVLSPVIAKVYRLSGSLEVNALEPALIPYATNSMYIYVFDTAKHPILLLYRGQVVTQEAVEEQVGNLSAFLVLNAPVAVKDNDTVICYLSVNSQDFLTYKANRQFIGTMRTSLAAGAITAFLIALAISLFISSTFSKQTTALVSAITALGNGKRNITFSRSNTAEFDMIACSEEKLQEQLVREESLRRQWMLDVSHDLRTPVTAVKVQLEAIIDGVLQASETRMKNLLAELEHIEQLVNNLHDLNRYESPEMHIQPVAIPPHDFVNNLEEEFSVFMSQKELNGVFECLVDEPFLADEFLLQRCVSNILQNAVKYTEKGGEIICSVNQSPNKDVVFDVRNTGTLSEETVNHAFDRLYRGDKSRTDGGSGLGLSIAKAIVDLHHGSITMKNDNGYVCVTIVIPATT